MRARPATAKKTSASGDGADELRAQLRQSGLKVTAGRIAVLRELRRATKPLTHGEVADRLAKADLDKVTVWRILGALTEVGLVDRTDVGDRVWRFEVRTNAMGHDPHPHFMCIACNSVQCLPREVVQIAPRYGRSVVDVQIKGRCERCS